MLLYPTKEKEWWHLSKLIIFGAAEMAEIAHYYFKNDTSNKPVAFAVDDEFYKESKLLGLPIVPWSEIVSKFSPKKYKMHVAVSYKSLNKIREKLYLQCKNSGFQLISYVSSKSSIWNEITFGDNCFILENQTIQPAVKVGNNVMLWSGNHIGHGSVLGSHAYISSHVVISGHTTIGKRCFLGVNSAVRDFITIGSDSFIGMGAIVTRDLAEGSVVLPARSEILEPKSEKAIKIMKSTFDA